jgi:hypothetical protein
MSLFWRHRWDDAVHIGLEYLREMEVEILPSLPDELREWTESVPDVDDESTYLSHPVFQLPEMQHPLDRCAMSLMVILSPLLLAHDLHMSHAIVNTMLLYTQTRGILPASAVAFNLYSMRLWQQDRLNLQHALSQIALKLVHRFGEAGKSMRMKVYCTVLGTAAP